MSKVSFSERLRDSGWRLKEKAFWRHGRDPGERKSSNCKGGHFGFRV